MNKERDDVVGVVVRAMMLALLLAVWVGLTTFFIGSMVLSGESDSRLALSAIIATGSALAAGYIVYLYFGVQGLTKVLPKERRRLPLFCLVAAPPLAIFVEEALFLAMATDSTSTAEGWLLVGVTAVMIAFPAVLVSASARFNGRKSAVSATPTPA